MGLNRKLLTYSLVFFVLSLSSFIDVSVAQAQPFDSIPMTVYLPLRLEIRGTIPSPNATIVVISVSNVTETTEWGSSAVRHWMTANSSDIFTIDAWFSYDTAVSQTLTYAVWGAGDLVDQHTYNFVAYGIGMSLYWLHFEITTRVKPVYPTKDEITEGTSEKVVQKIGVFLDDINSEMKGLREDVRYELSTSSQWTMIALVVAALGLGLAIFIYTRLSGVSSRYLELEKRVMAYERAGPPRQMVPRQPVVQQQIVKTQRPQQSASGSMQERLSNAEKIRKFIGEPKYKELVEKIRRGIT